jgi:uncharacterized protein (TIGR02246 family)
MRTVHRATSDDHSAIAAIPKAMIDAWNRGDADAFAVVFDDAADFIAFEGTHLRGRGEIAAFHREVFGTVLQGSRLTGGVRFVRQLDADHAVMHAEAGTILPGDVDRNPSRDSMQLFVASRSAEGWTIDAVQNSRQLTLEVQEFLDRFQTLTAGQRQRVAALVATLADRR